MGDVERKINGGLEGVGGLQCCVHYVLWRSYTLPSLISRHSYLVLNPGAGQYLLQICELCLEADQLVGHLAENTWGLAGGLVGWREVWWDVCCWRWGCWGEVAIS